MSLLNQYIDIVNRAIERDRNGTHQRAVKAITETVGDGPIAIGVRPRDDEHPQQWYTFELSDNGFDLVADGKPDEAKFSWMIDDAQLSRVAVDPEAYISEPRKLEIDWIEPETEAEAEAA